MGSTKATVIDQPKYQQFRMWHAVQPRGQLKAEQQNGWTDYRDRAHYGREGNNINQSHILVGLDTYQQKVRKIGKSGLGQTNDRALQLIVLSFLEFVEQTVCCLCWF